MINLTTIDSILKDVYLGVVGEQIDTTTSPFFNQIEKSSQNIYGKEGIYTYRRGINGGVGCGSEIGDLPEAVAPNYITLRAPLKNIYGTIELSDKSIKATQTNSSISGMVNILNQEMESIIDSAKCNLNRMLYQAGDGKMATILDVDTSENSTTPFLLLDDISKFVEGMFITWGSSATNRAEVLAVCATENIIKVAISSGTFADDDVIYMFGSNNNEIYGIEHAINGLNGSLYGNNAVDSMLIKGSEHIGDGGINGEEIQKVLDSVEQAGARKTNLILMGYGARREYLKSLKDSRLNVDYMNLDGGFSALCYNGIPVYTDRFITNNTTYMINTDSFKLVQLGDWGWLEGNKGNVLHQVASKPVYTATIAKYCNLICTQPFGQAKFVSSTGSSDSGSDDTASDLEQSTDNTSGSGSIGDDVTAL